MKAWHQSLTNKNYIKLVLEVIRRQELKLKELKLMSETKCLSQFGKDIKEVSSEFSNNNTDGWGLGIF